MTGEAEWLWEDDEDVGDLAYLAAETAYELVEPDQRAELMRLSYPQYLKSAHWDHTRRRALLRAGYQCHCCEISGEASQ